MERDERRGQSVAARFDSYRAAITDTFVPLEAHLEDPDRFRAEMHTHDVGPLVLSDIRATEHVVTRSARAIRNGDPGHYKIGLQVHGYSVLSQDGREAALTPGDFAVYDTSRPYGLSFADDYRMVVAVIPRALLRVPERPVAALTARRISGRTGTGALLSPLLLSLAQNSASADPAVNVPVGEAVLDLLSAMLTEQLHLSDVLPPETHQRSLALQVRAFIAGRLGDPELTPTRIAEAHHVSLRYLHRLFEADGETVSGFIRSARLERCRRDLADPRSAELTVSAIASRWGFTNAAHFSRLFSTAYGMTPGQYRASAGA